MTSRSQESEEAESKSVSEASVVKDWKHGVPSCPVRSPDLLH